MHSIVQPTRTSEATALRNRLPDGYSRLSLIAFLAESALNCLDVYALFDLAVELITEVLDVDFVKVLHQSHEGAPMLIVAGSGWDDHVRLGETTVESVLTSEAGFTLTSEQPVIVANLAIEERFHGPSLLTDHGVSSGISVVIPGEFKPYGVLGAYTRRLRRFTVEDADFLRSAANVLGGAQENIRTRLQIERDAVARERRVKHHAALARCAQHLLASGGEDRLKRAVASLPAAARASYVFVERNVMDPELGLSSRTVAEVEQPGGPIQGHDSYWDLMPWDRMPTTRSALEKGETVVIIPSELESPEFEVYADDPNGVVSEIDAPILVNGEWEGLIGLAERESEREWTDEDRSLLAAVATMIGAFWERDSARDALMDAIRSKDMFLASVSHELRTPLTTVVGSSELLRDESLELSVDERAELLDMVVAEGTDLANIVADLLAAAKADSGTLTVSNVRVSLRAQAAQVLEGFPKHERVPFTAVGEAVAAIGDPDRVRQVIRNLLTNAERYGGEAVRIELDHRGEAAILRVCDNGAGIPEEDRERVFEAYESAHGVPGRSGSVGLGLAISRRLARLMDGDLTYRYEGGESIFEFSLPEAD